MKKLLILFLFVVCNVSAQILTSTDKGYIFVWVGDTIASQHTKQSTALSKAYQFKLENKDADVKITYPETEINVRRDDLIELLGATVVPDTLDLGTTILEPLPNNPILTEVTKLTDGFHFHVRMSEGSVFPTGGIDVYVDGIDQNNHATDGDFNLTNIDNTVPHCFFVEARYTDSVPVVFPRSNEICVPEQPMNITIVDDMILDDFNAFEVVVTDMYKVVLGDCRQGEIVDIPNIEINDHFFVKYKSEALGGLVSKMKVENGVLKYY